MNAKILDGRALARQVRAEVAARVSALRVRGCTPGLAVLLVGEDPASAVYVRLKERACARAGVASRTLRFDAEVSYERLAQCVAELNADLQIHGILIQLPLPPHIDAAQIRALLASVDPDKDVDGFHPVNLGRLVAGERGFVACTPAGCMRLLESAGVDPTGKHAVVVGRSTIVGKPMALLLLRANATVTVCHSRTPDLAAVLRTADIVVAAVGRPKMIRGEWLKPGAVVLDVGVNRLEDGSLCGDVDFETALEVAGALTPVPGGVGPMTIAMLLDNVCSAAEQDSGKVVEVPQIRRDSVR